DSYKNASQDKKDALDQALTNAHNIYNDSNATQVQVNQAKKELEDAIKGLDGKPTPSVDKSELFDAIEEGKVVKGKDQYFNADDSLKTAFDEAMMNAQSIYNNPNATQDQVNQVTQALNEAREALNGQPSSPHVEAPDLTNGKTNIVINNLPSGANRVEISFGNGLEGLTLKKVGGQWGPAVSSSHEVDNLQNGIEIRPNSSITPEMLNDVKITVQAYLEDTNTGKELLGEGSAIGHIKEVSQPQVVDKTELEFWIGKGKEKVESVDFIHGLPEDQKELKDAILQGEKVFGNSDATQEDVLNAIQGIKDALLRDWTSEPSKPINPSIPSKPSRPGSSKPSKKPSTNEELEPPKLEQQNYKKVTKYITGYPDGTFRPDNNMTRAEAATMFTRLLTENIVPGGDAHFPDVKNSDWFENAIAYMVDNGYMQGYKDGTFRPNDKITRGEFAQMVHKLTKGSNEKAPFKDIKGHWAEEVIHQIYGDHVIKGYPDGTFKPNQEITRREAVIMFNRLFKRHTEVKDLVYLQNQEYLIQFKDIDSDTWGYYEILDASNTRLEEMTKEHYWIILGLD
ncbi:MAG: S-layer homology domain-containing protein, partial [Tissierellia bacterium]|nr:S-layer homology domain-containing protein [Tissierellia bacterium]